MNSTPSPTTHESIDAPAWQVFCLCAAWCNVCQQYRAGFEALAPLAPWARFVWVDIEDEEQALGDVDVETFPTLLIADPQGVRFFGPMAPQPALVLRLLQGFTGGEAGVRAQLPLQADALWRRLQEHR